MSSLLEVVGNKFSLVVFDVSQVFFEVGVKDASSFADVEIGTFDGRNNEHAVVRLAVELFGGVQLGFRSFGVGGSTDEGARFAFPVVACSHSWCSGGWLP